MTYQLAGHEIEKLKQLSYALIDQKKAKPIIVPQKNMLGYWFGGGNMIEVNGNLYLTGRYRNYGDSRMGTDKGERGLELAIFCSKDQGNTFQKIKSFTKADLSHSNLNVKSIEGSYLHQNGDEIELYVSTEKMGLPYPEGLENYLKPNTGVWTIDRIHAATIEELDPANIREIIRGDDPQYWHIKDPFGYTFPNGDFGLFFCTHPYSWSSSNTGYKLRKAGQDQFEGANYTFFPRGTTWDVAITRGTGFVHIPQEGIFATKPPITVLFYDGGESLRNLDEHKQAVSRPRGYSCEEIGGAAYMVNNNIHEFHRLSVNLPMFISPYGLGTSRYVDVLETPQGYYATWQQSQDDKSQALVLHYLSKEEVLKFLN